MFPRVILPAPARRRQSDAYSQARVVKERLSRWRKGEYKQLWVEAVDSCKARPQSRKKTAQPQEQTQEELNAKRATKLGQDGQFTRALQSLCSSGMAKNNRELLNEMKRKHPPAPNRRAFSYQPESDSPQMIFSQAQVVKGINLFKRGSAPGPSGLRAKHLKAIIKSAPPNRVDKATEAITKLVNTMAAEKVPEAVAPYLCAAAWSKQEGWRNKANSSWKHHQKNNFQMLLLWHCRQGSCQAGTQPGRRGD